jgi:hypothetical protein
MEPNEVNVINEVKKNVINEVKKNIINKANKNINYNVDYELYYNLFLNDEAFEEGETEEEKELIRTVLYQKDMLAIFNMNKFDDDIINNQIRDLFIYVKESNELLLCMKDLSKKSIFSNEEIGLMMLFSFDYMYLSHPCISEYIKTGAISEDNLKNLQESIK